MARQKSDQLIDGFRDRVSVHIADNLDRLRAAQISADLKNAARGTPRDEQQAERWRRLGLL